MHRAVVSGFGLVEMELDDVSQELRLLARHRRDLVQKRSAVCCQIREHLDAILAANLNGLEKSLREAKIRSHKGVLQRIVTWAGNAASPDSAVEIHRKIWTSLDDDRAVKTLEIQALERDIASLLVQTPYVLLLSHPGINVVTAGELAGEMGPISHYANAKAITGRAGLFPSRYQSADVDLADGKIIRCSNRRLRRYCLA